jgi:hypothetical protein
VTEQRRHRITPDLSSVGKDEESTAAGIYGLIVSAAVMATSHGQTARRVMLTVVVTLIVYWTAERYARIVAGRIHAGERPTWWHVREELTRGWQIVTASVLPLVALVVVTLLGAGVTAAVLAALVCDTVLLCITGWEVGRDGRLTTGERLVSAAVAGLLGVGMIALKAILH